MCAIDEARVARRGEREVDSSSMNGKLALWSHYRCCDAALHVARLPRRARQDQLSLTLIYAAYSDMRRADVLPLHRSQGAPSYASYA